MIFTLYNLTDGSASTPLLWHTKVLKEGVQPGEEWLSLLLLVVVVVVLLLHGEVHLARLPPPRLVLCVVADGGQEEGEGDAD